MKGFRLLEEWNERAVCAINSHWPEIFVWRPSVKNNMSFFLTCVAASKFLTLWVFLCPSDHVACYELESKALKCSPKEEVECVVHSHCKFLLESLALQKGHLIIIIAVLVSSSLLNRRNLSDVLWSCLKCRYDLKYLCLIGIVAVKVAFN